MIKLLIGGSPCTHWSIAQKNNRETEPEGIGWELFKNYLIAKEKFKPDYFLYENNKSAAQPIKDQVSKELGVDLMYINSALVSAQNRQRFYAFNWEVEQPEDRGIVLSDVLENDVQPIILHNLYGGFKETKPRVFADKSPTIRTGCGGGHIPSALLKGYDIPTSLKDARKYSRKLTPTECERLQTLPDGYTKAVSNAQRYKGLGNGWTAEVIIHILNGVLKDIPRDEEIVVLSMYDGIGTGRYCLDKMGFTNVKYYAYEIDKYAKQVAMSNYPDIIQCGDAFDVRDPDWIMKAVNNTCLPVRPV